MIGGLVLLHSAPTHALPDIAVTTAMAAPEWATLQRQVLDKNLVYMQALVEKFVDKNTGYLFCKETWGGADGPDDAMETFYNWPLVYMLGGADKARELTRLVWEGHLDQYTAVNMYHREFITAFDWEHTGEGIAAFLVMPLSEPDHQADRERTFRFADFYTGRDESVDNYDSNHKIVRSLLNGSRGAKMDVTVEYWGGGDYFRTSADWTKEVRGDHTMNLVATSLAANAWISGGDSHYKDWLSQYAGAWADRAAANGGNVPSNVGLDGQVGQYWEGDWFGGLMGWDWVFGGWGVLGRAVRIGFENAYVVTRDTRFLSTYRAQLENLLAAGKSGEYPGRYGYDGGSSAGWYNYGGGKNLANHFAVLHYHSLDGADYSKAFQARGSSSGSVLADKGGAYEQDYDLPWLQFLKGDNHGWPEKSLKDALSRLNQAIGGIGNDNSGPDRAADHVQTHYSRAATAALVQQSMGGPNPIWSGGLCHSELRHFDAKLRRPGLPPNVAALVTAILDDRVAVTLVNTGVHEQRILLQAGAYGEHVFEWVEWSGERRELSGSHLEVSLGPGAGVALVIGRKRHAAQPTFAMPWDQGPGVGLLGRPLSPLTTGFRTDAGASWRGGFRLPGGSSPALADRFEAMPSVPWIPAGHGKASSLQIFLPDGRSAELP